VALMSGFPLSPEAGGGGGRGMSVVIAVPLVSRDMGRNCELPGALAFAGGPIVVGGPTLGRGGAAAQVLAGMGETMAAGAAAGETVGEAVGEAEALVRRSGGQRGATGGGGGADAAASSGEAVAFVRRNGGQRDTTEERVDAAMSIAAPDEAGGEGVVNGDAGPTSLAAGGLVETGGQRGAREKVTAVEVGVASWRSSEGG